MIITDIMGGLGNQLFQYATVKSLSLDKNVDFLLNLSYYNHKDAKDIAHVEFKLNHFNIDLNEKIIDLNSTDEYSNIKEVVEPLSSDNFANFMDLSKFSDDFRLRGYWQDENYFKHNKDIIKNDLKITTPPNKKNQKLIDEITSVNGVCMSFRRGEYLDPYFIAQFGMCTENYYKKAINFISKKVDNPVFFIFSDDIEWIDENVKLDFPTVPVNINGLNEEHEELRLMTLCNHYIMANSSFSWWGAWLSHNKDKVVFAPTPWFNSFTKQNILCQDWIHLKCDRSDLFKKSEKKIFELIRDDDFRNIVCEGIDTKIGRYGISLFMLNKIAFIKFNFNNLKEVKDKKEYIIEFKLYSENKGLIKIDYGEKRKIILGYRKGYTSKYLHLLDIDLNNLNLEINDIHLIIENITIKEVNSEFNLIFK